MVWQEFKPKPFEETDVDIQITHCGVCASDVSALRSGRGPTAYPVCVGHEIVGTAVRVGSKVEGDIKPGDRVGVGAQSLSCLKPDCYECTHDEENYCQNHHTGTYNSSYTDGSKSYGGYANYWRGPSHFVIKIPDALASDVAAPMLCGGVTTFSPLTRHGAGPGKAVGIIGLGGLGHFGVMGARALGCDKVVSVSRTSAKKMDAIKMGATDFIATAEGDGWVNEHVGTLDIIICTVSEPKMPLGEYLALLKVGGVFVMVGAPEDNVTFNVASLQYGKKSFVGSGIGSPQEIKDMLQLFADKGVRTWNQNVPMKDANKAIVAQSKGQARYRFVLVN